MGDTLTEKLKLITKDLLAHQSALDNVSAYIFMKDIDGRYTYANKMVRELFNCSLDDIVGKDDSTFFSLEDSDELTVNDRIVMDQGISIEKEERNVIMETGEERYYWTIKKPIFDKAGQVIGLNGISTDITEQKQLQHALKDSERQLKTIINHVDAYIYMKDNQGRFVFVNDKTAALFGVEAHTVKGKLSHEFLPAELADNFDILDKEIIETGVKVEGEEVISNEISGDKYYWSTKIPIKDEQGKVMSFVGFSTEITKIVEEKKELETQASTDELTNLANRRYFMSMAYRNQEDAIRRGSKMSLMIIDLDYFKRINDQFGHHVGDLVLQKVAQTLRDNVRESDLVSRIGGEEFAILLPDTPIKKARVVAEKIRSKIENLILDEIHQEKNRLLTASIGLATCELKVEGVGKALIKADDALYQAKNNGRNQVACH